ncbi:SIR2 family NAD-dependent protein deacylase [Providencia hangzhouensis]|uniref:SIR2 family NAD-dependent protein deacylase n=2 Tax=Providencia hangzhouensis TaxID=3031799 RepID=UPI0034DDBA59
MEFSDYQAEIIKDIKSCLEGLQVQPILFMGAGISQRYIESPCWENLLKYLAEQCPLIKRPYGYFSQMHNNDMPLIASDFSELYAEWAWDEGKNQFPENYFDGQNNKDIYIKHQIAQYLNQLSRNTNFEDHRYEEEIKKLQKIKPHAIITTNYDDILERIFENYQPIVGQDVVTVNYTSYGEIMKIHGSTNNPESIIITKNDYDNFYKKRKYISAKLLTYFAEHPLFFFGYSINDENIKSILSDIDEIIAPNNALIPNIYLVSFNSECEKTGAHQKEILIGVGDNKSIRIKVIYANSFGWVYDALSSNTPEISVNPKLIRALLARTYTFASQSLVKQELEYDFEMLKQIAEEDNTLPKLYGIAELNNGQALNANYPFTMSEVAKALGHNSWHAVQNIIDQIEKEKGFDIKSNDNNYHITIMTGKTGFHKYSHLAVELMRKVISDEEYELNL